MVDLLIGLLHTNLRLFSRLATCIVLMSALVFGLLVRHLLACTALPMPVARLARDQFFALLVLETNTKERASGQSFPRIHTHTHTHTHTRTARCPCPALAHALLLEPGLCL
jgi:hypothetical protein